jgi:NADPH:quinone reductase-like Zn-dependent oxidoreductase
LQFARMLGAEVIVTSSSDEKLARAKELGASHGVNYNNDPDWGKTVKKLTGGVGVDQVIEVGGAGTLENSLKAIRIGGAISLIGILAGTVQPVNVLPILMQEAKIQGIFVGHREAFEDMNRALSVSQLKPVVDQVFPFEDAVSAFQLMADGKHFGKIAVKLPD